MREGRGGRTGEGGKEREGGRQREGDGEAVYLAVFYIIHTTHYGSSWNMCKTPRG